jgi:hypothetical protein
MTINLADPDMIWFVQHRDRTFHIRNAFGDEHEAEFDTLGPHQRERRKIILWKVPHNVALQFRSFAGKILKTPFLAFADEEIRDDDETLGPILNGIMEEAAKSYGMKA